MPCNDPQEIAPGGQQAQKNGVGSTVFTDTKVEQLSSLQRQLRACEIMLFAERARVRDVMESQIHALDVQKTTIANLNAEVLRLRCERDEAQHAIKQLRASRSWRMTMPYRMLARVIRGDWQSIAALWHARSRGPK